MGMLSSMPSMNDNNSEIAKPKDVWGMVRAVLRILVKHDDAAFRKGKFSCYSPLAVYLPRPIGIERWEALKGFPL